MDPLKVISPEGSPPKEVNFRVLALKHMRSPVGDCATPGGIAHSFPLNCCRLIRRTWAGIWPTYARLKS
jgi:hypothetical protein